MNTSHDSELDNDIAREIDIPDPDLDKVNCDDGVRCGECPNCYDRMDSDSYITDIKGHLQKLELAIAAIIEINIATEEQKLRLLTMSTAVTYIKAMTNIQIMGRYF